MSPYARQFVEQLEKPDVDLVEGLPPSVAIEQRVTRGGGKSTVATVTEVTIFSGSVCKNRNAVLSRLRSAVKKQSLAAIIKQVETAAQRGPLKVLAPLVKARKGFHTDVARWAERQGFDTLTSTESSFRSRNSESSSESKNTPLMSWSGIIDSKADPKARKINPARA